MADLLVHAATAFVPARPLRDGRVRSILYVGVCLPDLLYNGLLHLLDGPPLLCEPIHSPLGVLPWCLLGAFLFEESWRNRAFWALLAGCWLHLLVDVGMDSVGDGVVLWAFPFTMDRFELGWYRAEDSIMLMLLSLVLILLAEMSQRQR